LRLRFGWPRGGDAVGAFAAALLRGQRQTKFLAHHTGEEASDRMPLPTGRLHDCGDRCALGLSEKRENCFLLGPSPPGRLGSAPRPGGAFRAALRARGVSLIGRSTVRHLSDPFRLRRRQAEFRDLVMTRAEPRIPRAFAGAEIGDRQNPVCLGGFRRPVSKADFPISGIARRVRPGPVRFPLRPVDPIRLRAVTWSRSTDWSRTRSRLPFRCLLGLDGESDQTRPSCFSCSAQVSGRFRASRKSNLQADSNQPGSNPDHLMNHGVDDAAAIIGGVVERCGRESIALSRVSIDSELAATMRIASS
jgi:hypothetical protein